MTDTILINMLLVLILIMGFLLRMPYFSFPLDDDFGFYNYIPHFYKRGARLVKDFWIGFPFTIVSFNSFIYKNLGNNPRNARLALAVFNIFNAIAIFLLSQYLYGIQTALLAVFIYSFYSNSPHLGTYSSNTEGIYILPVTIAIYIFSIGLQETELLYFTFSGLIFAISFLVKIVNIITFTIFLLFLFLHGDPGNALNFAGAFISTLILYLTLITIKFRGKNRLCWSQHNARTKITLSYIEKNFRRLLRRIYLDLKPVFQETSAIWFLSFLFFIDAAIGEKNLPEIILFCWAVSTLLIFILQRSFWMYHYIPLIHIFSILSAVALFKFYAHAKLYPLYLSIPVVIIFFFYLFKNIYHKTKLLYLYLKNKCLIDFPKGDQYFLIPVVADYVKKNSTFEDYIYVWGSLVHIYVLADRRSCESFLYHYTKPFERHHEPLFDEITGGIISKKPKFIVMSRPDFDIKILEQITGLQYELQRVFFNRYRVYKLKGKIFDSMEISKLTWEKKKELMEKLSPGTMDAGIDEYYMDMKKYDKAMDEFEEAMALNPHDTITKMGLAKLYSKKSRYSDALKLYNEILKKGKWKDWVYLEIAFTCIEMSNYQESLKYFRKAISKGCAKEWGYLGLAIAYREMGDFKSAFKNLDEARAINPVMKSLHIERGITYRKSGKYNEAFEEFEKALTIDPSKEWIHFELGVAYRKSGKYNEAFEEFEKALKIDPSKEWIHFELGVAYKALGKYTRALTEFEKEYKLNPTNQLAKYNYFSTMKLLGNGDSAVKGFIEILNVKEFIKILNEKDFIILKSGSNFHLGEIFFNKGDYKKACNYFKTCLKYKPSHKRALEYIETVHSLMQVK